MIADADMRVLRRMCDPLGWRAVHDGKIVILITDTGTRRVSIDTALGGVTETLLARGFVVERDGTITPPKKTPLPTPTPKLAADIRELSRFADVCLYDGGILLCEADGGYLYDVAEFDEVCARVMSRQ